MEPIQLPPPFAGKNDRLPIIAVQSPQCETLLNFNVNEAGVSLRKGDHSLSSFFNSLGYFSHIIFFNGQLIVAGTVAGEFRVYSALLGFSLTLAYTDAVPTISPVVNYFVFKQHLFIITITKIYIFDGTTWGLAGYTPSINIVGGSVYKSRAYLVKKDSQSYYYSENGFISGALSEVDLSGYTEQASSLAIIAPVSVSDVVQGVDLLAFVFDSGEVLYYSGSYPDSSDWGIVGRGTISTPISYSSVVSYQGDKIVMCQGGIYSLKDLFLKANKGGESLLYNENINKEWISDIYNEEGASIGHNLYESARSNTISAVHDPVRSRIIFLLRQGDYSGATPQPTYCKYFIYNTDLECWYTHLSALNEGFSGFSACGLCLYQGNASQDVAILKFSSGDIIIDTKEGSDYYYDAGAIPYSFEITSAPIANGRSYVTKAAGMDIILETDQTSITNYQLIKDLGQSETTAQVLPELPTGIQKPFVNMGIEGSYIQYKISGSTVYDITKTVGLHIYGVNIWLDNGNKPR